MFQFREYQERAVNALFDYFNHNSGNPLIAMPTGTGKSVVIALFLYRVLMAWAGQKIIICAHVKELVGQNYDKLISIWPNAPAGINSAELKRRDVWQNCIFASIQSIYKKGSDFGLVHLLIIDEAHMLSPEDESRYQVLIRDLKKVNPHLKVIGLTATNWRSKGGLIYGREDTLFTDLALDLTSMQEFNRFFAEGYLTPLISHKTALQLDVGGVGKVGGDFNNKQLVSKVDKTEITEAAIRETVNAHGDRNHWLGFFSGVHHAIEGAQILNDYGIPTIAIHSDLKPDVRDEYIRLWKSGKYKCATNNNILTTGIDFPGLDLILALRPTMASWLWVQMLGRLTRPVYADGFDLNTVDGRLAAIAAGPKQNGLVLDFSGNTKRLGPINDPVIPNGKKGKPGPAPVKECSCCPALNHISAQVCVECGTKFTFKIKISDKASELEVIKADLPLVKVLDVTHVTYRLHQKEGSADCVRISYYCGIMVIDEYIFPEAKGESSLRKFYKWWGERSKAEPPKTALDALGIAADLPTPTQLRVWINNKYPGILGTCFDGTAFGAQTADRSPAQFAPKVFMPEAEPANEVQNANKFAGFDDFDDDIPF